MRPKRHLAFALLLFGGCTDHQPPTVVEPRHGIEPAPRGAALLRRVMLERHAAARADAGVPPLVWSDLLAADALAYAEEMARTGRFAHAMQPMDARREGENLFRGTRDAYTYREMIDLWIAERTDYVNAPTPAFSRTGRWQDVAHYSQMVWRRSTAVGCALASNAEDDYLVCRYTPPGNVVGQRAL